jgi:hypothetical protein
VVRAETLGQQTPALPVAAERVPGPLVRVEAAPLERAARAGLRALPGTAAWAGTPVVAATLEQAELVVKAVRAAPVAAAFAASRALSGACAAVAPA